MCIVKLRSVMAVGFAICCAAALASPAVQIEFAKLAKPPKDSALAKVACATCHVPGKPALNAYGKDMASVMKKLKTKKLTPAVMKGLAKLDSDKDKASNEAEVKAGTLPGDPKSKP